MQIHTPAFSLVSTHLRCALSVWATGYTPNTSYLKDPRTDSAITSLLDGGGFVGVSFHEASTHPHRSLLEVASPAVASPRSRHCTLVITLQRCQLASTALPTPTRGHRAALRTRKIYAWIDRTLLL